MQSTCQSRTKATKIADHPPAQPALIAKGLLLNFKSKDIKILGQLKSSPSSLVLLGCQERPVSRKVVVKIIRPTGDQQQTDLFLREVESVSKLNHKNIVRFFACSHHLKSRHYIVMEHISGLHLLEHTQKTQPSLEEKFALVAQISDGLTYIHHRGLIHGDLKPENILVTQNMGRPTVKLIDFGLSRKMAMIHTEKESLMPAGTLGYLDPHSIKHGKYYPGVYSDTYALGIILFELITEHRIADFLKNQQQSKASCDMMGSATFHGALTNHIVSQLQLSTLHKIQKKNLAAIVKKCIHPNPENRFSNLNELITALNQTLALEPFSSDEDSLFQRAIHFWKRHQKRIAGMASAALLLVFSFGIAGFKLLESRRLTKQAAQSKSQAGELLEIFSGILGADDRLPFEPEDTLTDRVYQSALTMDTSDWSPETQRKILQIYAEVFKNKALHDSRTAVEYKLYLATLAIENLDKSRWLEANERFGIFLYHSKSADKALPLLLAAHSVLLDQEHTVREPEIQKQRTKRAANIARFICKGYRRLDSPQKGLDYLKPYQNLALSLREQDPTFANQILFEWAMAHAALGDMEQAEKIFNLMVVEEKQGIIVLPEHLREQPIKTIQE